MCSNYIDLNWQNQIVNWSLLQAKHAWQNTNEHCNLYLHGDDITKLMNFIDYYFNVDNDHSRVFKVISYDQHLYSFKEYNPSRHSLIIWEYFNPNEFSKTELHDVLNSRVLSSKRYLHTCNKNSFKSSMLFVSEKNVTRNISQIADVTKREAIMHKLMIVEAKPFFGSFLYKDMCLNHIENELLEYDYETRLKFIKYWFDNIIDFHIEFSATSINSGDYMRTLKIRFKYSR